MSDFDLRDLMALIDENQQNMREADYIKMCSLIKSMHESRNPQPMFYSHALSKVIEVDQHSLKFFDNLIEDVDSLIKVDCSYKQYKSDLSKYKICSELEKALILKDYEEEIVINFIIQHEPELWMKHDVRFHMDWLLNETEFELSDNFLEEGFLNLDKWFRHNMLLDMRHCNELIRTFKGDKKAFHDFHNFIQKVYRASLLLNEFQTNDTSKPVDKLMTKFSKHFEGNLIDLNFVELKINL